MSTDTSPAPGRPLVSAALAVLVAAAVVLSYWYLKAPRATPVGVGDTLPALALPYVAAPADSMRLDTVRGEPALLVFLEATSPGGRVFTLGMEELHRRFLRRGLRVVAVALDDPDDELRTTVARRALTFPLLHDPGGRLTAPRFGTPQPGDAYLVGPDGRVLQVFARQEDWSEQRVVPAIEAHLRGSR